MIVFALPVSYFDCEHQALHKLIGYAMIFLCQRDENSVSGRTFNFDGARDEAGASRHHTFVWKLTASITCNPDRSIGLAKQKN